MTEYFIAALNYSRDRDGDLRGFAYFWRPDDNGYTQFLDSAGRYTRAQIEAHPHHYNDGENTLAVPCEAAEAVAHRAVHSDYWTELRAARLDLGAQTQSAAPAGVIDLATARAQRGQAWLTQHGKGWTLRMEPKSGKITLTIEGSGQVEFPATIARELERGIFLVTGGCLG